MNYELIRGWHDDLISGDYVQCQRKLEDTDAKHDGSGKKSQCCLGVLCRTAIRLGLDLKVNTKARANYHETCFGEREAYGVLPEEVVQMLYGPANDGVARLANPQLCVNVSDAWSRTIASTDLNDDRNYDFAQIAACVKLTWPEAFTE